MNSPRITKSEILSDKKYIFKRVSFMLDGTEQTREIFDRGNGATILLYNIQKQSVILTRQFRLPTYLNGNSSGLMIEACAGSIEGESDLENIIRETEEETGFHINNPQKIFEAYMSPGAVTEIIHFYVAPYDDHMKKSSGGGIAEEHENIEVLEMNFAEAIKMIETGDVKDAKTIMLLQYAKLHILN